MINKSKIDNRIIEQKDLATFVGSGSVDIYSTPSMISFMEYVSNNLLSEYINEDEVSLGISVDIKHIKSSKLGDVVL